MKRVKTAALLGAAFAVGTGMLVGQAADAATGVSGPKETAVKFSSSGVRICGRQQASAWDHNGAQGYAFTTNMSGDDCTDLRERAAGFVGARVSLVRSDGAVCKTHDWSYSTVKTSGIGIHTGTSDVTGSCSRPMSGYGRVKGRYWDGDTDKYLDGDSSVSPYNNY